MKVQSAQVRHGTAFTLLEVVIAIAIFFMATFAILGVVSAGLRNARALRRIAPDAGMVASELSVRFTSTNQVSEGVGSGDFGDDYPDYSYTWDLYEVETNHLCQLDIVVQRRTGGEPLESRLSLNLFLPNLQGGSLSGTIPR